MDRDRRFGGAFDEAWSGVVILDLDGTVTYGNAELCRMLGRDEADLLGLTLPALGHPDDAGRSVEEWRRVLAGEADGVHGQRRFLQADGRVLHVVVNAWRVRGGPGRDDQFVAQLTDLTGSVDGGPPRPDSAEQFPGVFDTIRIGMVVSSPDRRLLRVNRAACELLGYDAEELTSRKWRDLTHPDDVADSQRLVRACLDGEIPGFSLDQRFLHADGRVVTVSTVTSLAPDDAGWPLYFTTQMIGIVEARTLHQQLRGLPFHVRMLEGLSELGEGVVVYDGERIVYANDALCGLTGYPRGELMAMDAIEQLLTAPKTEATRSLEDGGDLIHGTLSLRHRDGSVAPAEFATVPLKLDGHVGEMTIVRDLTERLRVNVELQAVSQSKTDLLAMLTHDIGQPLTAIRGYAQTLTTKWSSTTDETRLKMLGQIGVNAERMGGMISQVLTMGRAEDHSITLERDPVPVVQAIQHAVATVSDTVPGIVVTAAAETMGLVDPGHLQQMLINLLTNAGKYGQPPIDITTHTTAQGWVEIIVSDHGQGIPAEHIPHLFNRYTRAGRHGGAGTGLGLFIVRSLAEANGGQLRYEPDHTPGASFVLTLPTADVLAAGRSGS